MIDKKREERLSENPTQNPGESKQKDINRQQKEKKYSDKPKRK